MTTDKVEFYNAEAKRCAHLAARENCPDAREYYEALHRDFVKLAARARSDGHA